MTLFPTLQYLNCTICTMYFLTKWCQIAYYLFLYTFYTKCNYYRRGCTLFLDNMRLTFVLVTKKARKWASVCGGKKGFMKHLSDTHHTLFVYNPVAWLPINKGLVTNKTLFFTTGKKFQRKMMLTFQKSTSPSICSVAFSFEF